MIFIKINQTIRSPKHKAQVSIFFASIIATLIAYAFISVNTGKTFIYQTRTSNAVDAGALGTTSIMSTGYNYVANEQGSESGESVYNEQKFFGQLDKLQRQLKDNRKIVKGHTDTIKSKGHCPGCPSEDWELMKDTNEDAATMKGGSQPKIQQAETVQPTTPNCNIGSFCSITGRQQRIALDNLKGMRADQGNNGFLGAFLQENRDGGMMMAMPTIGSTTQVQGDVWGGAGGYGPPSSEVGGQAQSPSIASKGPSMSVSGTTPSGGQDTGGSDSHYKSSIYAGIIYAFYNALNPGGDELGRFNKKKYDSFLQGITPASVMSGVPESFTWVDGAGRPHTVFTLLENQWPGSWNVEVSQDNVPAAQAKADQAEMDMLMAFMDYTMAYPIFVFGVPFHGTLLEFICIWCWKMGNSLVQQGTQSYNKGYDTMDQAIANQKSKRPMTITNTQDLREEVLHQSDSINHPQKAISVTFQYHTGSPVKGMRGQIDLNTTYIPQIDGSRQGWSGGDIQSSSPHYQTTPY